MEQLNKENYRTNHDYMSYSRFSRFLDCEAYAAAGYHTPSTESQLVGSYVDAYFTNHTDMSLQFMKDHADELNISDEMKATIKAKVAVPDARELLNDLGY